MLIDAPPIREYFSGGMGKCPQCQNNFDWWSIVLNAIKQGNNFWVSSGIGATHTFLTITLEPEKQFNLDFCALAEIPATARILKIIYTPQAIDSFLFPIEIHGNEAIRHFIPPTIRLYPMPMGPGPCSSTKVAIAAIWVPQNNNDEAWQNLVDAFEAYAGQRYS